LTDDETPKDEFTWHAHPARERTSRAVAGAGVIVLLAAVVFVLMDADPNASTAAAIAWSILSAVVLVLALNRFFFRSRFTIDAEGITARYPLRKQRFQWADLRRFVHDEYGGFLSTRAARSWLDAYRGMHLLFGEHRRTVIERIRAHLSEGAGTWAP
jgi:hypothetical protein